MRSSAVLAASGGGEELCQSLLGVVIGAVRDWGRGLVVFEGVDKLGKFLGRECGAAVCWNGERVGRPGNLASGFGCHVSIIAPPTPVFLGASPARRSRPFASGDASQPVPISSKSRNYNSAYKGCPKSCPVGHTFALTASAQPELLHNSAGLLTARSLSQ